MHKVLLALLAIASLVACNTDFSEPGTSDSLVKSAEGSYSNGDLDQGLTGEFGTFTAMDAANNSTQQPVALENRKMIWTANMDLQVSSVDTATSNITDLAASKGGFVSDLKMNRNTYAHTNVLTVRIPNAEFHAFISGAKKEAEFEKSVEISSTDVTSRYIDVESRLESKKEARKRYIEILQKKTGDVKDIIEAEDAIRRITEEIEAKESQLRGMKDQIDLSTVKVTLVEKTKYKETPATFEKTFGSDASAALANGWGGIKFFILVLLNIWPLLLIMLLVALFVRRMVRKSSRKKTPVA